MKELTQDDLELFITVSIFTAIEALEIDEKGFYPAKINISKSSKIGVSVSCSVDDHILQTWYFFTIEKPNKIIKECVSIVNEINDKSYKWMESYWEDAKLDYKEYNQTGTF